MKTGFTLIEVVVGMGVLGILVVGVSTFQQDFLNFGDTLQLGVAAQHQAQDTLNQMTKEVRTAAPSSLGAYPIVEADAAHFIFYTDTNDDGYTERIRYTLNGSQLERGSITPTQNPVTYPLTAETVSIVASGVTNGATAVFDYFDSSASSLVTPLVLPIDIPAVRLVRITISIDEDITTPPEATTVTTAVLIRNLKDNL